MTFITFSVHSYCNQIVCNTYVSYLLYDIVSPKRVVFWGENISYHSWCLTTSNFATSNQMLLATHLQRAFQLLFVASSIINDISFQQNHTSSISHDLFSLCWSLDYINHHLTNMHVIVIFHLLPYAPFLYCIKTFLQLFHTTRAYNINELVNLNPPCVNRMVLKYEDHMNPLSFLYFCDV